MDRIDDRLGSMTVEEMRRSRELHDFLRRVDEDLAQIGTIVLTNADGLRISSSTEFNPDSTVNLADRDYIRVLKDGHRACSWAKPFWDGGPDRSRSSLRDRCPRPTALSGVRSSSA